MAARRRTAQNFDAARAALDSASALNISNNVRGGGSTDRQERNRNQRAARRAASRGGGRSSGS